MHFQTGGAGNLNVSARETQKRQHYNKEHITYKEVCNTRTEDATGSKVTEDQEFPENSRCYGNRKKCIIIHLEYKKQKEMHEIT